MFRCKAADECLGRKTRPKRDRHPPRLKKAGYGTVAPGNLNLIPLKGGAFFHNQRVKYTILKKITPQPEAISSKYLLDTIVIANIYNI